MSACSNQPTTTHCHLLDVLKLAAILFIVCRHCVTGSGLDSAVFSYGLEFTHAYIYCEFFFMVTGFYLAAHVLRHPTENSLLYTLDKYRRFLPLHLLCLFLIVWAQLGFTFNLGIWPQVISTNPDLVQEALLIHRWGATDFIVNQPDWFLSALLLGSLLVHSLISCATRLSALIGFRSLAILICIVCYCLILRQRGDLGPYNTPLWGFTDLCVLRAVADLLVGVLIYLSLNTARQTVAPKYGTAGEFIAVGLFLEPLIILHGVPTGEICTLLFFAAAIYIAVQSRGLLAHVCSLRLVRLLCTLQLALYLCHWLVARNYTHLRPILPEFLATPSLLSDVLLCVILSIMLRVAELALRKAFAALKVVFSGILANYINNYTDITTSYPPPPPTNLSSSGANHPSATDHPVSVFTPSTADDQRTCADSSTRQNIHSRTRGSL